jgi:hypothetical protein
MLNCRALVKSDLFYRRAIKLANDAMRPILGSPFAKYLYHSGVSHQLPDITAPDSNIAKEIQAAQSGV